MEYIGGFLAQVKGAGGCTWHQNEDSGEKLNLAEHQWFMERHSVHVASWQGAVGVESFVTYINIKSGKECSIATKIINIKLPPSFRYRKSSSERTMFQVQVVQNFLLQERGQKKKTCLPRQAGKENTRPC